MAESNTFAERSREWLTRRARSLVLLALCAVLTDIRAAHTNRIVPDAHCCDHLFYRSMAFNFFTVTRPELDNPARFKTGLYADPYLSGFMHRENRFNRQPPYCYRIVTPLLARAINAVTGASIEDSFYAITVIALTLATFFVALTVHTLSRSFALAIVAAVAYTRFDAAFHFNLWDFLLTDPLAHVFVALSIYLMLTERVLAAVAVSLLGVFNRETQLLVLPCCVLIQLFARRPLLPVVAGSTAVVAVYFAFRAVVPVPIDTYSLASTFHGVPAPAVAVEWLLYTFGVLLISTLVRLPTRLSNVALLPILIGACLSTLVSTDWNRALVTGAPVALVVSFGVRPNSLLAAALALVPGLLFIESTYWPLTNRFALLGATALNEIAFMLVMSRTQQRRGAQRASVFTES